MPLEAGLVVTSIFELRALDDYHRNFARYDRLAHAKVFVVPDLKTPRAAFERCERLKRAGLDVVCPDVAEQEAFLRRVGFPPQMIPHNSDNRRNVGFLMCLEAGCDFLVSIDDDNHCLDGEDFLGGHAVVCSENLGVEVVSSDTGWYNVLEELVLTPDVRSHPRGFPYSRRHVPTRLSIETATRSVHMNAGLWLGDPDVDAMSWLVNPARAASFTGRSLVLADDTWSPVNTQNTSLRRAAIPSYYYLKMRYPIGGLTIDRFGDIYSGYLAQKCVKGMGGAVRVGSPVVEHRRNSHDYMEDASAEWGGIRVIEELLPWLTTEVRLSGATYQEQYRCLAALLRDGVEGFQGRIWTDSTRAYFHQMSFYMQTWTTVCQSLL